MKHTLTFLFVVPLLMWAAGCSVYLDYRFAPRPGYAEVAATQPSQPAAVTGYATIVGVRRDDPDDHIPASVEVRLRMQNNGPQTVIFDPRSMQLVTGELMRFAPPMLEDQQAITLAPMASATVNTYFPFPSGHAADNTDLDSLQLQWQVLIAGEPRSMGVNFHQWVPRGYYYDPYWDYPPPVRFGWYGPGVVVVHRF